MAKRVDRTATDAPRSATGTEWEVFVREAETAPLKHVGSVTAPTETVAREQARQLLGWSATDVWLCPAAEVERFSTSGLAPGEP